MIRRFAVYLLTALMIMTMPGMAMASDSSGSSSFLNDSILGAVLNTLAPSGGLSISGSVYGLGTGSIGINVYQNPGQLPTVNFNNQVDVQPGGGSQLLTQVITGGGQLLQTLLPSAPVVQGGDLTSLNTILEQLKQQFISNPGAQPQILQIFTNALQSCQGNTGECRKIITDMIALNPNNQYYYKQLGDLLVKLGEQGLKVWCNGSQLNLDVNPLIKQGRTLVPIGQIAQALGATVAWDPVTQQVRIAKDGDVIELKPGQITATVNGQPVQLSIPAEIDNGRLMVPLRFIAQALNADVDYYSNGGIISVNQ
ncbi:MAG: copper amine oxidase N-terminal domain-containing protein [Candidatus Saccharibacteria bacterium]